MQPYSYLVGSRASTRVCEWCFPGVSIALTRRSIASTPSFQGVIPGGQSFAVPQGNLTTVAEQGLGFTWTPPVRGGTTVILLGGDNRGPGTAGSSVYVVNAGENDCLSDSSPSSTPGSPAGGAYPTSTSSAGGSNGGYVCFVSCLALNPY